MILIVDNHVLTPLLLAHQCKVTRSVAEGENAGNTIGNDRIRDVLGYRVAFQAVFCDLTPEQLAWLEYTVLRRGLGEHRVTFEDMGIMRTTLMHSSPNFESTIVTVHNDVNFRKGATCSFIELNNRRF